MKRIVALVPMRHHSERVPGKNFRPLAGKPLYRYILDTLSACELINHIVVDTDSPEIIAGVGVQYPQVQVIERPEHLRAGDVPMNEVLLNDTSLVEADFYLQTHTTNPLLRPATIQRAIHVFLANFPAYDSLFSVTRWQTRFWDALGRAVNHNPAVLLRTQDLPPIFEENSCLYLFTRQTLEERRHRIGKRPYLFEIDAAEAWDIDEELDFAITEFLMGQRERT